MKIGIIGSAITLLSFTSPAPAQHLDPGLGGHCPSTFEAGAEELALVREEITTPVSQTNIGGRILEDPVAYRGYVVASWYREQDQAYGQYLAIPNDGRLGILLSGNPTPEELIGYGIPRAIAECLVLGLIQQSL